MQNRQTDIVVLPRPRRPQLGRLNPGLLILVAFCCLLADLSGSEFKDAEDAQ